MKARLSDRGASRAVLIGVHDYAAGGGLSQLPAVERNVAALQATLCDETVWGLAESDCRVLGPRSGPETVMQAIDAAVREATDTLLVYYAGHGLLHPDRPTELHLALHDSNEHQMWRSLPYAHIRDEVRAAHRQRRLKCAVILDCCFSGAAVEGGMSHPETLLNKVADIDGVCVLTSSAATERAWSPPGDTLSAFTGTLLDLVRKGVPGAGPVLDFGTLHAGLRRVLSTRERPQHPQLGAHNSGERIAVFRNPAHAVREPADDVPGRGVPSAHDRLIGRDRELRELAEEAARGPGVLLVHGPPGVGKTALAAELQRHLVHRTPGFPHVGFPVVRFTEAVTPDWLPDAADVRPDALVLMTSHSALTGVPLPVRRYRLGPLTVEHAVELMQYLSGLTGHERELSEIARMLSCLPFALRPVAARLRRTPPDLLLEAMRESDHPLQHLRSDDHRVRAAFTLAYETLSEPQRRVLRDCAGHPGPDFDRHSAAALSRMSSGICGLMLEELVDAGLLQRTDGRYAFHDLYRAYCRAKPGAEPLQRTWLYRHLRERLWNARRDGPDDIGKRWRAGALPELKAAALSARNEGWALAAELTCAVADALREEGRFEEAREQTDAAHQYAAVRRDGMGMARARGCLAQLGAADRTGRPRPPEGGPAAAVREKLATELHERARDLRTSSDSLGHRGRLLMTLADRALAARLTEDALALRDEAATCLEEAGDPLLADCLVGEAALRLYTGDLPRAAELAAEAAGLLEGQADREGAAHAHMTAAEALRKSGDLTEAGRHAHEALERLSGTEDPATLSYAHRLAAKIAFARGHRDTAAHLLKDAHRLRLDSRAEDGPSTRAIAHPSRAPRARIGDVPSPIPRRP
ncbi:caspase, EACC1-associated type [Streptomyces sp. WG5]|uniref:caspase, EACC1-associated type n=1 Tax=Streptomyces sp. WG5 TaxID=3417648 RepID=UPI003CF56481